MELMKWFASIIGTIIGLCVIIGGVIFVMTFGAFIGALALIAGVGTLLCMGIKEFIDERLAARARRRQRAR